MAIIDGVKTTCLIDNGAWVNLVTPEFVKNRGLELGSIQDLNNHDGYIPLSGLGGKKLPSPWDTLSCGCKYCMCQVMTRTK